MDAIRVGGTYSQDLQQKALWILVYSDDGQYYPQAVDNCTPRAMVQENGVWKTQVFLNPRNKVGPIDIVLVSADVGSEADKKISDWLREGCKTSNYNYPGIPREELFANLLTEVDAITVRTAHKGSTP